MNENSSNASWEKIAWISRAAMSSKLTKAKQQRLKIAVSVVRSRPWAPRPASAVFRYPHGKIGGAEFAVLAPQAQRSGGTVVRI